MVAARAALRPFEYTGEQEIPAGTRALFAQMRARTLAWIVAVMGEAARGELDPNAAAIRARLTGPTARAGVGPFPLFDPGGDGDDVAYGSLVRLDVIEPHDSAEGSIWWVFAAQRVNVTSDTAVYGFRLDTGEAALAFRFEPPAPSYEAAAFGEVALRPLWHASRVRDDPGAAYAVVVALAVARVGDPREHPCVARGARRLAPLGEYRRHGRPQ